MLGYVGWYVSYHRRGATRRISTGVPKKKKLRIPRKLSSYYSYTGTWYLVHIPLPPSILTASSPAAHWYRRPASWMYPSHIALTLWATLRHAISSEGPNSVPDPSASFAGPLCCFSPSSFGGGVPQRNKTSAPRLDSNIDGDAHMC